MVLRTPVRKTTKGLTKMKEEIAVKSFTYAMKGKKALERRGITASVRRRASDCGCVYVLSVDSLEAASARGLLIENGVKLA